MPYKKQDRRVRKTKNAITKTLLQLMEQKAISDITVSELTEAADINRKTFYNHYDNLDSVLNELENNCSNWVLAFVKDFSLSDMIENPAWIYTEIARGLQRHNELLRLLYNSGIQARIFDKISKSMKENILQKASKGFRPEYMKRARLLIDFMTAGASGIYDCMYDSEDPASLEDVTDFFNYFFESSNIKKILKDEVK